MRKLIAAALLASVATSAFAQDSSSTSGSNAAANSGSTSGASSDNNNVNGQGQSQTANNAGIGTSSSTSGSNANAAANTASSATSNGNEQGQGQDQGQGQTQGQGQSANNSQGQGQTQTANAGSSDQGQMQSSNNTNSLGQGNQQGVTVNQTWNTTQRKKTIQEFRTNTPVMLAASSSFSSDYCGGTVSGGASVAPIGLTVGASGTKFDNSCRYLRLAEKAGMLGANYHNMGQPEMAMKAMSMMTWAVCMAGPQQDKRRDHVENHTMEACLALGLLGSEASPATPPSAYNQRDHDVSPLETQKPNVTPSINDYSNSAPKEPRGEVSKVSPPVAVVIP